MKEELVIANVTENLVYDRSESLEVERNQETSTVLEMRAIRDRPILRLSSVVNPIFSHIGYKYHGDLSMRDFLSFTN